MQKRVTALASTPTSTSSATKVPESPTATGTSTPTLTPTLTPKPDMAAAAKKGEDLDKASVQEMANRKETAIAEANQTATEVAKKNTPTITSTSTPTSTSTSTPTPKGLVNVEVNPEILPGVGDVVNAAKENPVQTTFAGLAGVGLIVGVVRKVRDLLHRNAVNPPTRTTPPAGGTGTPT